MEYSNRLIRLFILSFIMGMIYLTIEGFWRGWTNISMLFVGGICGGIIGLLNEPPHNNRKIYIQCLIGTIIVLIIEFISGYILNIIFKFNIWDYSNQSYNILGQICLPYAILWFLLIPFNIYIDDYLRYKFFNEEKPNYNILNIYIKLITLK